MIVNVMRDVECHSIDAGGDFYVGAAAMAVAVVVVVVQATATAHDIVLVLAAKEALSTLLRFGGDGLLQGAPKGWDRPRFGFHDGFSSDF